MKKIMLLPLFMLLLGFSVAAAECVGTLSAPDGFTATPFDVAFFNADPALTGNATLNVPAGVTILSAASMPTSPFTVVAWTVNSTVDGNLSFTVDAGTCQKNLTVSLQDSAPDPSLSLSIQDLISIQVNQPVTVQVNITNSGAGDARNVDGVLLLSSGDSVTPSSFSLSTAAGTTDTDSYSFTPTVCGANSFTVNIPNYEDTTGEDMGPLSGQDGFNVVGTDMGFTAFSADEVNPVEGQTVQLTAIVTNFGSGSASGIVRFAEEGVTVADVPVSGLAGGASVVASTTLTPGVGNRTVTAQIISSDECPSVNNDASLLLTVQQGVCGDGIVNNGEQCDGSSSCTSSCTLQAAGGGGSGSGGGGSGSSKTYNLELSEDTPAATVTVKRDDIIRVQVDKDATVKSYTFRLRSLFNSVLKLQLIKPDSSRTLESNEYALFDLDEDGTDDLKVEVKYIGVSTTELRFSLLGITQESNYVPIRDAPPPRQKTVTQPVTEEVEPEPTVVDDALKGVITFVEEFSARSTVPVWLGSLVSLLIVGLGLGAYFLFRKD